MISLQNHWNCLLLVGLNLLFLGVPPIPRFCFDSIALKESMESAEIF